MSCFWHSEESVFPDKRVRPQTNPLIFWMLCRAKPCEVDVRCIVGCVCKTLGLPLLGLTLQSDTRVCFLSYELLALFPAQLLSRRSQKLWRRSGALCVPVNSSSTCGVHSSQAQRRCILEIPVSFRTNHSDYGYKTVCDYAVLSLYHHVQLMRRINRFVRRKHYTVQSAAVMMMCFVGQPVS